jgi:hypothetical protein
MNLIYLYTKLETANNHYFFYDTLNNKYYCNIGGGFIMFYDTIGNCWMPVLVVNSQFDFVIPEKEIIINFDTITDIKNITNKQYLMCEKYVEKLIFDKL